MEFEEKINEESEEESKSTTTTTQRRKNEEEQNLEFITGNPRIEVITGRLQLYRPDENSAPSQQQLSSANENKKGKLLCVVAVPEYLSPLDLLNFTSAFREQILLIRVLKDPKLNRYMALLQFCDQQAADNFFVSYNGSLFNSLEQERCKIVFVKDVEFFPPANLEEAPSGDDSTVELENCETNLIGSKDSPLSVNGHNVLSGMIPQPPLGMTEIPTCAVCLDRLDISASGILTTLCNHTFHCECLFRWEGSNCPVCRYSHGDIDSACEVCGTTNHLWICLICGHIGCGRYSGEHAKQHYQETLHTYSLELETQRVWDYAGDGYVHRLILNKPDGKFVEFPNPNNSSGERSVIPPSTDADEEQRDHVKLEKLAVEYNFLLTSQLEEQRHFYERRMAATNETEHHRVVTSLEQQVRNLKSTNQLYRKEVGNVKEELHFLRELNQSLISNQNQWKERVKVAEEVAEKVKSEADNRIRELEGQVRDLMFYLDTQHKVENSSNKEELQEGQLLVEQKIEAPSPQHSRRRSSRKKK